MGVGGGVRRRGGVVKTKYFFLFFSPPLPFFLFLLHGRAGCVINCSRQWGIYVQVQMEVTSDLSCGAGPAPQLPDNRPHPQ